MHAFAALHSLDNTQLFSGEERGVMALMFLYGPCVDKILPNFALKSFDRFFHELCCNSTLAKDVLQDPDLHSKPISQTCKFFNPKFQIQAVSLGLHLFYI